MTTPVYAIGDRVIVHAIPMTIVRVLPVLDPRTFVRAAYCYIVQCHDGAQRIVTEGDITLLQRWRREAA